MNAEKEFLHEIDLADQPLVAYHPEGYQVAISLSEALKEYREHLLQSQPKQLSDEEIDEIVWKRGEAEGKSVSFMDGMEKGIRFAQARTGGGVDIIDPAHEGEFYCTNRRMASMGECLEQCEKCKSGNDEVI